MVESKLAEMIFTAEDIISEGNLSKNFLRDNFQQQIVKGSMIGLSMKNLNELKLLWQKKRNERMFDLRSISKCTKEFIIYHNHIKNQFIELFDIQTFHGKFLLIRKSLVQKKSINNNQVSLNFNGGFFRILFYYFN